MRFYKDKKHNGTHIELDGNELARAIDAYLVAHGVCVDGPRTVRVSTPDGDHVAAYVEVDVYVDPSGRVLLDGELQPRPRAYPCGT